MCLSSCRAILRQEERDRHRGGPEAILRALQNRRLKIMLLALALAAAASASFLLFYFRDNFSTHLPGRAAIGDAWRDGAMPLWNPAMGGGQPLAGNANFLAFYPTGTLQLFLPLHVAFNLHFWLHLIIAGFAMWRFLTAIRAGPGGAAVGALLYVSSGAVISTTAFYNLVTWAALIPAALLTSERLIRRPSAERALALGAVLGLCGLAAEPMMTLGTALLLAAVFWRRLTRDTLRWMAAAALVAIAVAAPQIMAFAEVAPEVERSRFGYSTTTVLAASIQWWRIPELIVGPVWGLITDLGPGGWRATAPATTWPPLFLQLTCTPLIIPSLLLAARLREAWRWLAASALLFFFALGHQNPVLTAILDFAPALRVARFPEKLALHLTATLVVLVALWIRESREREFEKLTLLICSATGAGVVVWLSVFDRTPAAILTAAGWTGISLASILLVSRAGHRRSVMIAVVSPALLAAVWSIPLDLAQPYLSASEQPRGRITMIGSAPPHPSMRSSREHYRLLATLGSPHFGNLQDISYVLDRSPEGMFSAASRIVHERFLRASPEQRLQWLRVMSSGALIDLSQSDRRPVVYRIERPLPALWVPQNAIEATDLEQAFRRIESESFVPGRDVVVPRGSARTGAVEFQVTESTAGTLRLRTRSPEGGMIVTNQTYFSSWRAVAAGETELSTFPANVDRLAFHVPAGDHELVLRFGRRAGLIALSWAVSWVLLAFSLAAAARRRTGRTSPAR